MLEQRPTPSVNCAMVRGMLYTTSYVAPTRAGKWRALLFPAASTAEAWPPTLYLYRKNMHTVGSACLWESRCSAAVVSASYCRCTASAATYQRVTNGNTVQLTLQYNICTMPPPLHNLELRAEYEAISAQTCYRDPQAHQPIASAQECTEAAKAIGIRISGDASGIASMSDPKGCYVGPTTNAQTSQTTRRLFYNSGGSDSNAPRSGMLAICKRTLSTVKSRTELVQVWSNFTNRRS